MTEITDGVPGLLGKLRQSDVPGQSQVANLPSDKLSQIRLGNVFGRLFVDMRWPENPQLVRDSYLPDAAIVAST